jgi:hypothetical protein
VGTCDPSCADSLIGHPSHSRIETEPEASVTERLTKSEPEVSTTARSQAESRSGAVVWGPVSTPRPSNRTGRFPTSGFRTRHFRQSLTEWPALTSCETLPPKLTLKVRVGEAYLPAATHSEFRARPLTHPVINMLGDRLGRLAACPDAEYVGPTLYLAVDLSNLLVNFQPCGIPAGHHAHFVT